MLQHIYRAEGSSITHCNQTARDQYHLCIKLKPIRQPEEQQPPRELSSVLFSPSLSFSSSHLQTVLFLMLMSFSRRPQKATRDGSSVTRSPTAGCSVRTQMLGDASSLRPPPPQPSWAHPGEESLHILAMCHLHHRGTGGTRQWGPTEMPCCYQKQLHSIRSNIYISTHLLASKKPSRQRKCSMSGR